MSFEELNNDEPIIENINVEKDREFNMNVVTAFVDGDTYVIQETDELGVVSVSVNSIDIKEFEDVGKAAEAKQNAMKVIEKSKKL